MLEQNVEFEFHSLAVHGAEISSTRVYLISDREVAGCACATRKVEMQRPKRRALPSLEYTSGSICSLQE